MQYCFLIFIMYISFNVDYNDKFDFFRFKSMYHADVSRVERKAIILLARSRQEEEDRPREPSSSLNSLWNEHDARIIELNANATRPTDNGRAHALNLVREFKQTRFLDRKGNPLQWWHSKADHSIFRNFSPIIKKNLYSCNFRTFGRSFFVSRGINFPKKIQIVARNGRNASFSPQSLIQVASHDRFCLYLEFKFQINNFVMC